MPKGKKRSKGKGKGKAKGKGTRGKGKNRGKKAVLVGADGDTKKLFKAYDRNCALMNSQMSPGLKKLLRAAAEENRIVTKLILESVPVEKEGDLPVLFEPLMASLRQERYKHVKDIHVWDYPLSYEDVASLALFLEKSVYPVRLLELLDCLLDAQTIPRLAKTFYGCERLTTLVLDYNEFGDEGCKILCNGLENNVSLLSLSLCYCNLGIPSGSCLGHIISTTAVRELFLDGNELECEGTIELIKLCVDQADIEAYEREEEAKKKEEEKALLEKVRKSSSTSGIETAVSGSDMDQTDAISLTGGGKKKNKKGKGKRKKKKKAPPSPPPVGPWLHKLHLADNGIDGYSKGGTFAPVICMRLFKKLLMNSKCLVELDVEDNCIGELGGREVLEGLTRRKEAKLGGCKARTTHKMTPDTFKAIVSKRRERGEEKKERKERRAKRRRNNGPLTQ
ncbi:unnamed protein product [Lymnaea stagnalis]|uniref:Uncharacterized protein n=1 Tax=Lymnaea stagnalis TaxID=6523 RepID=A0AAV2IJ81_LYMST